MGRPVQLRATTKFDDVGPLLDLPHLRRLKRGKFGAIKYVYPAPVMAELRRWFQSALATQLPAAKVLYFT